MVPGMFERECRVNASQWRDWLAVLNGHERVCMHEPFPYDPDAFRAFELAGWQRIVDSYDGYPGSLTAQSIEPLLDAARVGPGAHMLDEATGPGYVAAAAARRGAAVIGSDFSPAMIAEARRRYPHLEFREADAEELPFANGAFDAVVMNFGMLHLGHPERAAAEVFRVLRPGGHFAFTAWAPPERSIGFGILLRAIQTHGTVDVPLPPGPAFFRFGDAEECARTLIAAGFCNPLITALTLSWALPNPDALLEALLHGTVRTAALLRAQTPDALETIRAAMRAEVAAFETGNGIAVPMGAMLASGEKPGPGMVQL